MFNATNILTNLTATDLDAGEVFSGTPSGHRVKGYTTPGPFTPAIDHRYIFHESSRDLIVWFIETADPLYVFGPYGSGKTSCIKQLAARLNYPVFEVTGHGRLEFPDLVGHLSVQQGSMQFDYGPLALAMKYGGLFLLNEIDLLDPSTAAGLNSTLDGAPLCIPENGGELITPHPMFRFAATANSNGGSDSTGLYQGIPEALTTETTLSDTEEALLALFKKRKRPTSRVAIQNELHWAMIKRLAFPGTLPGRASRAFFEIAPYLHISKIKIQPYCE